MKVIEIISYIILIVGVSLDHSSTMYALTLPDAYEVNPFVRSLMAKNLWLFGDIFVVITAIFIPYFMIRLIDRWEMQVVLAYPIVHGFLRICCGIHNLGVIF